MEIVRRHDNVRISYFICGEFNFELENSPVHKFYDWFTTTVHFYKHVRPNLLDVTLHPYDVKPKMFDALLGSPKPHRDFVYNSVQQNNLQDTFIIPYGGKWDDNEFYAKDYFIWEPDCVPVGQIIGTADWVEYCGIRTGLSRVIPIQTFNDTAYSIIAETDYDNTLSFFSEKTAKPLIARRLFVAFTGYKFLHNLRACGFRTFEGIIDESYDLIYNDEERYAAAFRQVRWLCEQPQEEILEQVRVITEHNYRLIMDTDWTTFASNQIQLLTNSAQR